MQKRKPLKRPLSLKEVIPGALKEPLKQKGSMLPETGISPLASLQNAWKELVGPQLGKKSRPSKLMGKKLLIEVATASWAHEMEFLKRELLNRVRIHLPEAGIEDFRCQITTRSLSS